jgi:hypothetical protein
MRRKRTRTRTRTRIRPTKIGVEMVHNRLVGAGALSLATTGAYSPGRKGDQH